MTACEMRILDWSSDVCSSDLRPRAVRLQKFDQACADAQPPPLCVETLDAIITRRLGAQNIDPALRRRLNVMHRDLHPVDSRQHGILLFVGENHVRAMPPSQGE